MEDGEAVRESVVSTAVKFLQNDKVAHSSEETKRNFLAKKGLTEEEIQTAFKQVETVGLKEPSAPAQPVLYQQQELLLQQRLLQQQSGFSSRVKDLLNVLLLIGGFSYGVRYLWKNYVQPWLFGITKPSKSPQETLMDTCNAILTSVDLLKKSVVSLESSLDRHSDKLDEISQNMLETSPVDGSSMKDIKSEVQSVKGILLSSYVGQTSPYSMGAGANMIRRNIKQNSSQYLSPILWLNNDRSFPQNPLVTPPRIPSWQLDDDAPDLLAKTGVEEEALKDGTSGNGSSISEIEMLNPDSNEQSGEETQ